MKTSILKPVLLGAVVVAGAFALAPAALADNARMYEITITNATLGQPVAPSVIATHTDAFRLFEPGPVPAVGDSGYDAYFALATMAETGYPFLVLDEVAAAPGVWEAKVLATNRMPPVLLPSESNHLTIGASGNARYLSAAAMLGATNDAFYAVRGVALPKGIGDKVHVFADAYDAGGEANAESPATTATRSSQIRRRRAGERSGIRARRRGCAESAVMVSLEIRSIFVCTNTGSG